MALEGSQQPEIKIEKFPFNEQEPNRAYHLEKNILPGDIPYAEFWVDKDKGIYSNWEGLDPNILGEKWKSFTQELLTLGITGMYVEPNKVTLFVNKSGGEEEPKWGEIEPKFFGCGQMHLYENDL